MLKPDPEMTDEAAVIDQQQYDKGCDQHHDGDGGGAGVIVLLQLGHDEERDDLGAHPAYEQ